MTAPSAFDLPLRLAAKADPALIADDERRFDRIASSLRSTLADLTASLTAARRSPGGVGQQALDRDLEIHRLTARRRTLARYGVDLCLGRMVVAGDPEPVYIGRLGLTDADGERLLTDWRSPAAEPFFGATLADPMGLVSRRRYRWSGGRVTDYWDEALATEGFAGAAALDDQSEFIASLGASRSTRMRDVLATLQADQDAIIREGSRGALVVDGGPGTGKTVVALHRAAYLLYSDPRLEHRRGGVLFVGPSRPYLAFVSDVPPALGEEGVQLCTLADLVEEGADAVAEADPTVAGLKADGRWGAVIETAVRGYERPPAQPLLIETEWADIPLTPEDWADAFASAPGVAHDDAREEVWEALLEILVDRHDGAAPAALVHRVLAAHDGLRAAFDRAWPMLDPAGVVADLWTTPGYLRRCAPWLSDEQVALLQRVDARAWTSADLPLLDAARRRIGDPDAAARRRRRRAAVAAERERMAAVVDDLIAADDDGEGLVTMLRGEDVQTTLVDDAVPEALAPDELAGPFAHVVVDEAQELTDAEWGMLLSRCPSRSFTIVGDRAQARQGFSESWRERLARVGVVDARVAGLSVNYRTPSEVMAVAEPVIRAVLPDATVPSAIRSSGVPVGRGEVAELGSLVENWLAENAEGVVGVIAAERAVATARDGLRAVAGRTRVQLLTPALAKGLEFDLVVLVDPTGFGGGVAGGVDRYVAMTRATRRLVLLGPDLDLLGSVAITGDDRL